ncbi:unnamed protein product [Owenia fusiformis]|uniref:NAD(P)(+)--arginine ADP-ribosyltransferase n=1 Tax=Owenia fusiformis TaxID=6347 RepID=A0A8J1U6J4_OWEFU|nr:unnamed protein product [Owenia fusiformis]
MIRKHRFTGGRGEFEVNPAEEKISLASSALLADGGPRNLFLELPKNAKLNDAWSDALNAQMDYPSCLGENEGYAITAYTSDECFEEFNADTRSHVTNLMTGGAMEFHAMAYRWKGLYHLLRNGLKNLNSSTPIDAYRGMDFNPAEKLKKKDALYFKQFTSTTTNKSTAAKFGKILFAIKTYRSAPIDSLSFFSGEDEVLIPPNEIFVITDISETPRLTYTLISVDDPMVPNLYQKVADEHL